MNPPEGFIRVEPISPFLGHVGPLMCRSEPDEVILGLRVDTLHCNRAGSMHGGMVCAMLDTSLGHNVMLHLLRRQSDAGEVPRIATVSLSTDYLDSTGPGDWIESRVVVDRVGRTMAYASGVLVVGDRRIAGARGVFRVLGGGSDAASE